MSDIDPEVRAAALGLNDDYEDDYEDEEEVLDEVVRAKWAMDGAATLSEAADQLRGFASYLEKLESEGWQLTHPVEDDYGFIRQAEGLVPTSAQE